MKNLNFFLKRSFDIIVSIFVLVVFTIFPLMIVIPIIIKMSDKGPAFYKQERVGKNKKIFMLYKFRTMTVEQFDKDGNEIMSENRITKVGKILRKTSLDELPQLFNVLNGSMSIVGPRPMLNYQAKRCNKDEELRFSVRPGLTGLAQIKGRNNIPWEERIKFDIEYIKSFSFWFDIIIIFKTALLVLKKEGTEVKPEYRGVDRFSKFYVPEEVLESEETVKINS